MRTIVYTGTLQALSSIAHGARPTGNAHPFRRETLIQPNGKRLAQVPVVSGGNIRGSLRRAAAAMTQAAITDGTLPHPVVHALRTGGSLRETRTSGDILTGERQAVLRNVIPMFGVFGLTAGGRVMSGRLQVDKALPVSQETAYLAQHYDVDLSGYEAPSIFQVIQRETYTRIADVNDAAAQVYIDDPEAAERDIPKGSGNMIYQHETISAGSRLFHSITLDAGTAVEVSFLDDLVRRWGARGRVGGMIAKGHGRVAPDYDRQVYDVNGDRAEDEPQVTWREHMRAHAEEVREVLKWL